MVKIHSVLFLITASILAISHNLALYFSLYWYLWWFDLIVHTIGGAVVTLGVFVAYDLRLLKSVKWQKFTFVMVFVFFVAILWEIFELAIGIPIDAYYLSDTLLDLLMGILGGALGYFIGKQVAILE